MLRTDVVDEVVLMAEVCVCVCVCVCCLRVCVCVRACVGLFRQNFPRVPAIITFFPITLLRRHDGYNVGAQSAGGAVRPFFIIHLKAFGGLGTDTRRYTGYCTLFC